MAKKVVGKKSLKKKIPKIKRPVLPKSEVKLERVLIENFVSLQKVMVNLSIKIDNLTNQLSKLLNLFEISAKVLAEKDFSLEKESKDSKKIINKIDNLFEQNKVIARGLTLMHERMPEPEFGRIQRPIQPQQPQTIQQPAVPSPGKSVMPVQEQGMAGYQKSISSAEPAPLKFKPLPKQKDVKRNF